jgi:F-type H+-transporting ATPase subunit a
MDHHFSWYHYFPGYHAVFDFFNGSLKGGVLLNGTIMPVNGRYETVHHIFAAGLVFLVLALCSLVVRAKTNRIEDVIVPSKKFTLLNFFELIYETLCGVMRDIIGHDYKRHVPFVGTLCLFILFSNLLGLVPGFLPPTDNLNTTLACGLAVFVYFNYQGLRAAGIGHLTHLANPLGTPMGWFLAPLLFPIELIGLIVRPFSLAIRLAGNMIGDHKVLFAFASIFPLFVPLPFFVLGLMVALIQTGVFCLLTCVYISLHTQEEAH